MDLLSPLEDLTLEDLKSADLDTKIPIPSPKHLRKTHQMSASMEATPMKKYGKEYELFCEWAAMPKDLRKPKTAVEFEKRYLLPKSYTNYFKSREDFRDKTLTYFWNWMMDIYPDVVYAVYKQSVDNKNMKAAAIFLELISKKMNLDKPRVQVQPMVLMGVPQEKIDALFVPKDYDNIADITPKAGDKRG